MSQSEKADTLSGENERSQEGFLLRSGFVLHVMHRLCALCSKRDSTPAPR